MSFLDLLEDHPLQRVRERMEACGPDDVERALGAERLRVEDYTALLSPAAEDYLEAMAARAHRLTVQRFGRNIFLYAPLYLSNVCTNACQYCGFRAENPVPRRTLTVEEAEREALILHRQGFRHVLLLTGEAPSVVGEEYLEAAVRRLRPLFSSVSLEVFPMEESGYRRMVEAGVDGLTIYQETYDRELYDRLHPYGKKRDFAFRLATPERAGRAGMRRIGIGALLGLGEFRSEAFYTGLHAQYLSKNYWRSLVTVSFPRMRPAEGCLVPENPVSDRHLVQLICATRLLLPDAGLVLSTRESAELRDNLLPLGITQMSAGSCTAPGGYGEKGVDAEQFAVDDVRAPEEVARLIAQKGYEAVWKDWDRSFLERSESESSR